MPGAVRMLSGKDKEFGEEVTAFQTALGRRVTEAGLRWPGTVGGSVAVIAVLLLGVLAVFVSAIVLLIRFLRWAAAAAAAAGAVGGGARGGDHRGGAGVQGAADGRGSGAA
ncbi:spore germination protein [Rathayibacter rathayi]|uniref:spore germination protein n=2 Tax=Rathayibacter rathayi TaxID=33887 RepID=UPI0011B0BCB2|nr:spore germination protein [Rathayibacter rathayi]